MARELYFIFSGTDMYWEQSAIFLDFDITTPHNLGFSPYKNIFFINKTEQNLYYCFDGVSIEGIEDSHIPITHIEFDPSKPRLMRNNSNKNYSFFEKKKDWLKGIGMKHNARHALNIIYYLINKLKYNDIEKIHLIGFSRGGATCLIAANCIYQKFKNRFKMDLFLIDPVPGPHKFIQASSPDKYNLVYSVSTVPECVERCFISLALQESLRGFEPLDINKLYFSSNKTKFMFLPFPDDHLQNVIWSAGLLKNFFPNMPTYCNTKCKNEKKNIHKKLLNTLKESGKNKIGVNVIDEFFKKSETYKINLKNKDNTKFSFAKITEKYYKSIFFLNKNSDDYLSVQNLNSTNRLSQKILGFKNKRQVYHDLEHYTTKPIFVNKHQELCFSIAYPNIYNLFRGKKIPEDLFKSEIHFMKEYPSTFNFFKIKLKIEEKHIKDVMITIENELNNYFYNKPNNNIINCKSTNLITLNDIYEFFYPYYRNPLKTLQMKLVNSYLPSRSMDIYYKIQHEIFEIINKISDKKELQTKGRELYLNVMEIDKFPFKDERSKTIELLKRVAIILEFNKCSIFFKPYFYNELVAIAKLVGIHKNEFISNK